MVTEAAACHAHHDFQVPDVDGSLQLPPCFASLSTVFYAKLQIDNVTASFGRKERWRTSLTPSSISAAALPLNTHAVSCHARASEKKQLNLESMLSMPEVPHASNGSTRFRES